MNVFGSAWLLVLAAAALAARVHPGKPLWLDEFLHFPFGAYGSTADAWGAITRSMECINHNQTGVYMLLDAWLLRGFGAGWFLMRVPSLVAGGLLWLGALRLFEVWKLPAVWRVGGCAALYAHGELMVLVAEARPYMPLAAATVATFAYYSSEPRDRARLPVAALGWAGMIGGAVMHPYFSVYAVAACALAWVARRRPLSRREFVAHVRPLLAVSAAAVYLAVAWLTWMRRSCPWSLDPFMFHPATTLPGLFVHYHLAVLRCPSLPLLALPAGCGLAWLGIRAARARPAALVPPLALLAGALGLSLFLSALSYRVHYWILPRQWAASLPLATLALIQLSAVLVRGDRSRLAWGTGFALAVLVGVNTGRCWEEARVEYRNYIRASGFAARVDPADPSLRTAPTTPEAWIALANRNCAAGGPVWPVFLEYYGARERSETMRGGRP